MAKVKKQAFRTIYFIEGPRPTDDDVTASEAIGGVVVYRNALKVADDGALEDFDAVAGAVPDRYREAADAKAAMGDGEALPEPKAELPPVGSPLKVKAPAKAPDPKPNAAAGWKPNA